MSLIVSCFLFVGSVPRTYLKVISALGTLLMFAALALCVWCVAARSRAPLSALLLLQKDDQRNMFLYADALGASGFFFYVHFALFNLQHEHGVSFQKVFKFAYATAWFVSIVFCHFCTWGLGTNVSTIILNDLNSRVGLFVRCLASISLLFSFPLMAQTSVTFLSETFAGVPAFLVRFIFIVSAATVATCFNHFEKVINFVGGVCSCVLGIVIPAVMYTLLRRKLDEDFRKREVIKAFTLFVPGCVTCLLTTFSAIADKTSL